MAERLFRCTRTVPASDHCLCWKTSRNSIMEKHSSLEDGLWEMVYRDTPPHIASWIHWPEARRTWKLLLRYLWTFITCVSCFLHWPWYPFICPLFIISQGQMAHSLPLFHHRRSWDKRPVGQQILSQRPDGRGASPEEALSGCCHCCCLLTCSVARWSTEGSGEFPVCKSDCLQTDVTYFSLSFR